MITPSTRHGYTEGGSPDQESATNEAMVFLLESSIETAQQLTYSGKTNWYLLRLGIHQISLTHIPIIDNG
jgi:hypothetical protein